MTFLRPLGRPLATITFAFLAASATRSAADDILAVLANAGQRYDDGTGVDPAANSNWASVTSKTGSTAFAGTRGFSTLREKSVGFTAMVHLAADAGPRYWEKSFPGMEGNRAEAAGHVTRDEIVTLHHDTAYQMKIFLNDAAEFAYYHGYRVSIFKQPEGDAPVPAYERVLKAGGSLTDTGTLPAGTYRIVTTVDADTPEVGLTYFEKRSVKSVAGIVEADAHISFLDQLTPDFLEWSGVIASFLKNASHIRARADELGGLLAAHATALELTREDKPSGFDRDFHVVKQSGGKGGHLIVPADAARAARFTDAVTSSVASYKRYKKGHDDFALLAAAAVKKGHLPATSLLELDTRVPSLPSATDKHLAALSFFRKDRSYTAADVGRVRKNYDAAAAWFAGKLPGLRKQAKALHGSHDFVPGALSSAAKAYRDSLPGPHIGSRELEVLLDQINFGYRAWQQLD